MKKQNILKYQGDVLKALAGRIDDFYLVGGTALSLFYFQHRLSEDLDFFTKRFSSMRVKEVILYLERTLNARTEIVAQNLDEKFAKIIVCNIIFKSGDVLKIDFVEDVLDIIKDTKIVNGIQILSLEDIYLRKIYAVSGVSKTFDAAGREIFTGGRTEAKDFYDLYFLSHTFMPLAKFTDKYIRAKLVPEGLIRWFRTYDRMKMIDGVLTLDITGKADCKLIEKHFKKEIDKILEMELEGI